MHIQDTAGNAQPHLSIDLHSDTESKETDMPQHITKKMQRTRQWIKTGELFPKSTLGLAEDPKALLSHLKHLSEDLANTHVTRNTNVTQTLDHLIKHAQALTTIVGHDSAKTVLTHPDTLTSLNGALQQCDRQIQVLDKSAIHYKKQHHEKLHHETREKLTELENLLGEVKVHITKQALSEVKVPGVDVISDMYAISECIDEGIWTHNNGEQRSVPQLSAYARNAKFSCQKLNQHLHERPSDIHQIQQLLPIGLNEILSQAFSKIERIATGCPDPQARHALASLASSIQKLSFTTVSDSTALEPGENSQSGALFADKSAQQNPLLNRLAMKTDIYWSSSSCPGSTSASGSTGNTDDPNNAGQFNGAFTWEKLRYIKKHYDTYLQCQKMVINTIEAISNATQDSVEKMLRSSEKCTKVDY